MDTEGKCLVPVWHLGASGRGRKAGFLGCVPLLPDPVWHLGAEVMLLQLAPLPQVPASDCSRPLSRAECHNPKCRCSWPHPCGPGTAWRKEGPGVNPGGGAACCVFPGSTNRRGQELARVTGHRPPTDHGLVLPESQTTMLPSLQQENGALASGLSGQGIAGGRRGGQLRLDLRGVVPPGPRCWTGAGFTAHNQTP